MNRQSLIVVGVIVLIIVAGVLYLGRTNDKSVPNGAESSSQNQNQKNKSDQPQMPPNSATKGEYLDYKEGIIEQTSGTKILFFYASWCPQCRSLDADIKKEGVPSGVAIIKVDYDSNQALRKKYGVTLQTTLVKVDDQGRKIDSFVAYDDPSLQAIKNELL